jgi:hypothetical protein
MMDSLILETSTLPELLIERIHSPQVRVVEKDGFIALEPLIEPVEAIKKLRGMLKDEYFSLDAFLERKHSDKELEV